MDTKMYINGEDLERLWYDVQLAKKRGIIIKSDEDGFTIKLPKEILNRIQTGSKVCFRDKDTDRVISVLENWQYEKEE